jgi:hypothetical protein
MPGKFLENCKQQSTTFPLAINARFISILDNASASRTNCGSHRYRVRLISLRARVNSIGDYLPSSFHRLADPRMYSSLFCQDTILSRASMSACDVNAPAATIAHVAQKTNSRNLQPVASLIRPRVCTRLVACPFPFCATNGDR